jgi:hypothetical protein
MLLLGSGGCERPRDTCDRLADVDSLLEQTVTRCLIGTELKLGIVDVLQKYKTPCKTIKLVCGEDALAPVATAIDCLESIDACVSDATKRSAAEQALRSCSDRIKSTSPSALLACVPGSG